MTTDPIKDLRQFMVECPKKYDLRFNKSVRKDIRRALFQAASLNGKYIKDFFPELNTSEVKGKASSSEKISPSKSFDWIINSKSGIDPAHPGRPCVRKFAKGEPTYRCLTCGLDNTCVLCSYCYNPDDHQGHQVIINISLKDEGGVCDCGDPEAWVNQFSCKHHNLENFSNDPIPHDFEAAILSTIEASLDFVIDVLSTSDLGMQKFQTFDQIHELSRISKLSANVYGSVDEPDLEKYVLILWNDQRHSFNDVNVLLREHLHKNTEFGDMVGNEVDSYGRGKLIISSNLEKLLRLKKEMEETKFVFTIRSLKDYFREEMCDCIIHWLEDLSKASIGKNYFILHTLISRALCSTWNIGNASLLGEDKPQDETIIPKTSSSLNGVRIPELELYPPLLPNKDFQIPLRKPEVVPSYWLNDGSEPQSFEVDSVNTRIQYLIFFDIRLWKGLRNTLKDLYISVLVSNSDYKAILGHSYAQLYPQIAELYILVDREPECSIFNCLSTQLFTTPSIATSICQFNYFSKYMAGLFNFFTQHRIGPVSSVMTGRTQDGRISDLQIQRALKNRRYGQLFHDFEFILNRNTDKALVTGDVNRIAQLCDFLLLFQGILPLVRQTGTHVEFEPDAWINYFNCIPLVLQLANSIAVGISSCSENQIHTDISTVADFIYQWALGGYFYENNEIRAAATLSTKLVERGFFSSVFKVYKLRVEDDSVSLHHPLHALLSWFIQFGGLKSPVQLRNLLASTASKYPKYSPEDLLAILFEYPLRTLVFLTQIRIGLWVRNGVSVRSQMHYYRDITLRDQAFDRDIFMVQTSLIALEPQHAFLRLMETWGLTSLETNPKFDENQRIYMVEDFLHYLIVFIVERRQLLGLSSEESKRKYIFKEIIQCLAFGPLSYSDMCVTIPDFLTTDELFEVVLNELCTFKPPTGIRDTGLYELKSEYYKYFDTKYLHFSPSKMYDAEKMIKQRLQKKRKVSEDSVIIDPYLEPITSELFADIAGFTRTTAFASFVYSLLVFIIETADENDKEIDSLMNLLLYLCHVAALDDLSRPSSTSPYFVTVMCADYRDFSSTFDNQQKLSGSPNIAALLFYTSRLPQFKTFRGSIQRILELLYNKDSQLVEDVLKRRFGDISLEEINPNTSAQKDAKDDLRKLAKRKKKKIMDKFQKQQQMFAEQNLTSVDGETLEQDEVAEDVGEDWDFSGSQCILCHMPCDEKKVFGIVANVQISNAHRTIPFDKPDWVLEAYGMSQDLCESEDSPSMESIDKYNVPEEWDAYCEKSSEKNPIGPGFPRSNSSFNPVISSCCHTMHQACYSSYLATSSNRPNELTRNNPDNPKNGEILCPLCRSLNNTFIPVLWNGTSKKISQDLITNTSFEGFVDTIFTPETFHLVDSHPDILAQNLSGPCITNVSATYSSSLGLTEDDDFDSDLSKSLNDALTNVVRVISREVDMVKGSDSENEIFSLENLFQCVSGTIDDVELSLRGAKNSHILLNDIPPLTLTLLRALLKYTSLTVAYSFGSHFLALTTHDADLGVDFVPLQQDSRSFDELVKCVLFHSPAFMLDKKHFIKAYLLREISYTLARLTGEFVDGAEWTRQESLAHIPTLNGVDDQSLLALSELVTWIRARIRTDTLGQQLSSIPSIGNIMFTMLIKSVTPFLRKVAILFFARSSQSSVSDSHYSDDGTEADRLCRLLEIPTVPELLYEVMNQNSGSHSVVKHVISKLSVGTLPQLDYPAIQKLLHLPNRLDQFFTNPDILMEEDNPAITYIEPSVCLFCGETVRTQHQHSSYISKLGECNAHREKCGKSVAIFLLPKRSAILFLTKTQGSYFSAPYLDLHGEGEETYRRRRPQYISKIRYDHLCRTYWLQHGIVDYISRRLSSAIDVGGWDTL